MSGSSFSSSPSKTVALCLVEKLRNRWFESEARKVSFKSLLIAILVQLGRILFQIVVTISGFLPTLVVVSHIGLFVLERCLEIFSADNACLRMKKTAIAFDMVCALEENLAFCVIRDASNLGLIKAEFHLPASSTVADLYEKVGDVIKCHQDSFSLVLQGNQNEQVVLLNLFESKTIEMAGFKIGPETKNTLVVMPLPESEQSKGSSSSANTTASGDYETSAVPPPPPPPPASTSSIGDFNCTTSIIRPEIAYVGLVNQAMTCYLNSLLQALYMTPEFRNAIYNWEFDGSPNEESKSIPYQLQRLFLNLQTSKRSAVETTELTRSFGWDSWEAWQQHDIQELCRVMFDTLEQKFKNTKQADLINRLYEGKMIDYVKCLECSTEKSREDTFLDIPLPVRPFGSNVAYGSVEEALRAFVQPETLEGNNQYHCDTCNKKCDAHKGLKFSKFPYLLTLHLKRFDFDFNTLHRIKLNDKVSFPEKLNLNSFIPQDKGEVNSESTHEETTIKCDDSCTTDSGSALDDEGCQGIDTVNVPNSHENHRNEYQEDDEGIDVEQQHEMEKNKENASESGPYIYELFSIMIHSGSASGGHYYAYIKDFRDGEWYCFNDQNVTKITYDDIKKTYGGGPIRGYYSGAYSSSTNAYMLMYRQIDKERNTNAMTVDEFPEHIKALHQKLEKQKELDDLRELDEQREFDKRRDYKYPLNFHSESIMGESDLNLCKLKVYCHYPHLHTPVSSKVFVKKEYTLKETLEFIYKKLNLQKVAPIERCRLVSYDALKDAIEYSFEGKDEETIGDIALKRQAFLIDIREEDEEFVVYKPGNINTVVLVVNIETKDLVGPTIVRANLSQTVKEYKEMLINQFKLPSSSLFVALEKFSSEPKLLQNDESTLKAEEFYDSVKVFVANSLTEGDVESRFVLFNKHKIVETFERVITLHLALPDVDSEILESLNIPPLDQTANAKLADELSLSNRSRGPSPNLKDPSPQSLPDPEDESAGPAGPFSDQSASEDSSLTDSERTIVGDAPGDCLAQLSPNGSPVGSDQNVSSSENEDTSKRIERYCGRILRGEHKSDDSEYCDADDRDFTSRNINYYFRAVAYSENNSSQKMLKVSVDERMNQKTFKQCLEPFIGVSSQYFEICRTKNLNLGYSGPADYKKLNVYKNNERLTVKLMRALKKGEYAGKVFLLALNNDEPIRYLFEWIIASGSPVSQVKKEILEEIKEKCAMEIPYNRCRLRKKKWKVPMEPYLEGTTFEDLITNWELFVQELPGDEPVTSSNQELVFVRQLCPSREVKPLEEIVLDTNNVAELKEKISELSGIPVEFLEMAEAPRSFSCFDVPGLDKYWEFDWDSTNKTTEGSSTINIYDAVHVIFYRDNRDKFQCYLAKHRKLHKDRENRLYSPIKEKGLKIYSDGPPPRKDESDVD